MFSNIDLSEFETTFLYLTAKYVHQSRHVLVERRNILYYNFGYLYSTFSTVIFLHSQEVL